jgi:hypothetical protein
MALIAILAIGLAALKNPSLPMVFIILSLTITVLLVGTHRARYSAGWGERAWWFGFCVFGWPYFVLSGTSWARYLPTVIMATKFVNMLTFYFGPHPTTDWDSPWYRHEANHQFAITAMKIVELYITLLVAAFGSILLWALAALRKNCVGRGNGDATST